jgi:hypothetical protein
MTDLKDPTNFTLEAEAYLNQLTETELFEFTATCTDKLEEVLLQGFDNVNEGFNPYEGTKPINLIREKLFPVFERKLETTFTTEDIPLREEKIIYKYFTSDHPLDLAIKALQEKLKLIASPESMMSYVAFTNALEKTIHGGLSAQDPMFVKADKPAEFLYVVFAGMVCFPEFKKSISSFGSIDQLHVLDPNRSWYMQGPEGEWDGYEYYTQVLSEQLRKLKAETPYKRVCFLGNSMGGSAACLYAQHADAVLAFCPQTEIPLKTIEKAVNDRYQTILAKNLSASKAAGKKICIHRGIGERDIAQCDRLPEGIDPIIHEGCDVHNLPGYLKEQGILLDVLGSVRY